MFSTISDATVSSCYPHYQDRIPSNHKSTLPPQNHVMRMLVCRIHMTTYESQLFILQGFHYYSSKSELGISELLGKMKKVLSMDVKYWTDATKNTFQAANDRLDGYFQMSSVSNLAKSSTHYDLTREVPIDCWKSHPSSSISNTAGGECSPLDRDLNSKLLGREEQPSSLYQKQSSMQSPGPDLQMSSDQHQIHVHSERELYPAPHSSTTSRQDFPIDLNANTCHQSTQPTMIDSDDPQLFISGGSVVLVLKPKEFRR